QANGSPMSNITEPPANLSSKRKPLRRRPWYRRGMHWIRRIHLYTGLFMFPWVLLYGITAFLFNHPAAFPDQQQICFGRAEVAGTPLENLPKAKELAEKVVQALAKRASASKVSGTSYRLVEPNQAAYSEDVVFSRMDAAGQRHNVVVHLS